MSGVVDNPLVAAALAAFAGAEVVDAKPPLGPETVSAVTARQQKDYSLQDLHDVVHDEACNILARQEMLVRTMARVSMHGGELQRARKFMAAARLILRCRQNPKIIAELRNMAAGPVSS